MARGTGCSAATQVRARGGVAADVCLNEVERSQLGSLRCKRNGEPSAHPFPTPGRWPALRSYLVERSRKANPALDESLTAYTPGETEQLLDDPRIAAWHAKASAPAVGDYTTVVLVPCAKTKPWVGPATKRSKLYSAYNQLRSEYPEILFATISEPLGIVTMNDWANFPQYDNPGLFADDAQRSGMTAAQWKASKFGETLAVPFDPAARERCLARLGTVVGEFIAVQAAAGRRIISVVDEAAGPQSTHGAMLDVAVAQSGVQVERHPKRLQARISPLPYLRSLLA